MDVELIRKYSKLGELEYAEIPPSGADNGGKIIKLEDILSKLKPFSVRKPVAYIVGSLAVHGESHNDIDIVVRGEDWSDEQKTAFLFRLYRMFSAILNVPYEEVPKYVSVHFTNSGPFTSYVPIYEETFLPIQEPEIIEMSSHRATLTGHFEIKEKKKKRIIAGYASIPVIDEDNELITKEALEEALKEFIKKKEYANIMLMHRGVQIGRLIEKWNGYTTHVDDTGLFIVAEIRDDIPIADRVWKDILDGKLNAFSIGFDIIPGNVQLTCDGKKCYTEINKIALYEISIVDEPANKPARFTVLSKGSCKGVNIVEAENMSEEINNQTEEIKNEETKGGLVDAIKEQLSKILADIEDEDLKKKLEVVVDLINQLGGRYPLPSTYPYPKYPLPTQYPYPKCAGEKSDEDENLESWMKGIVSAIDSLYEEVNNLKSKISEIESTLCSEEEEEEETEEAKSSEQTTNSMPTETNTEIDEIKTSIEELKSDFSKITEDVTKISGELKEIKDFFTKAIKKGAERAQPITKASKEPVVKKKDRVLVKSSDGYYFK